MSDGANGALFVGVGREPIVASCKEVDAKSPIGCGDALTAGFVMAEIESMPWEDQAQFAVATATAAAMLEGTAYAARDGVEAMLDLVEVDHIRRGA